MEDAQTATDSFPTSFAALDARRRREEKLWGHLRDADVDPVPAAATAASASRAPPPRRHINERAAATPRPPRGYHAETSSRSDRDAGVKYGRAADPRQIGTPRRVGTAPDNMRRLTETTELNVRLGAPSGRIRGDSSPQTPATASPRPVATRKICVAAAVSPPSR